MESKGSLPVIQKNLDKAIQRWRHLVPDEENETTKQINNAIKDIVFCYDTSECIYEKMKKLTDLISDFKNRSTYANYTHMVLADPIGTYEYEEDIQSFLGMVCSINSCLGGVSDFFWSEYKMGYFGYYLPEEESEFDF